MRWSLILSAFIAVQSALSFVCVALVIPLVESDELERRADPLRLSSKQYRENSKAHPYGYHVTGLTAGGKMTPATTVTETKLKTKKQRLNHGNTHLKGNQADHVLEVQMVKQHLKDHKIDLTKDAKVHKKVQSILNGPKNMAIIPASINSSKGQLIKNGMAGKAIKPQKARDEYTKSTFKTADKTARRIDKALQAHPDYNKKKIGGNTLQKKLKDTFVAAGLHKAPGTGSHPSSKNTTPKSSRPSTPKSSRPSTPGPSNQSKKAPSSPNRSSKRNVKKQTRK